MLSNFSPADSIFLKKPEVKKNLDPELRKLRADKRKAERAVARLDHIYLYSNKQMSDKEYLIKKNDLMTDLKELDKSIGLLTSESWAQSLSDDDFLEQASSLLCLSGCKSVTIFSSKVWQRVQSLPYCGRSLCPSLILCGSKTAMWRR